MPDENRFAVLYLSGCHGHGRYSSNKRLYLRQQHGGSVSEAGRRISAI
ncbi:hypothetical protein [Pontibacter indicus]|nr:hypothetical protein [Pontibacter indicus]